MAQSVQRPPVGERRTSALRLSVALPVYNEEAGLEELLRRLGDVLGALDVRSTEIVLVDDGSSDRSAEILRAAAARDPRIRVVELSRNFGHQTAITAALDHVTGDAVIVMDADLQDPPEEIGAFLARWREGYDVVYARRVQRKENVWLRLAYWLSYRTIRLVSGIPIPPDAGDFALLAREPLDALRSFPESQRYLRGLRAWVGFRQVGIDVERAERYAGTSQYTLSKLLGLALDGVFAFSVAPLRVATVLGFLVIAMSIGYSFYALWAKLFFDSSPRGFTGLIFAIVFLAGVQMLFLGILGEYVGRIYVETKRRPHYVVRRVSAAPREHA